MIKKILFLLLIIPFSLVIASCGNDDNGSQDPGPGDNGNGTPPTGEELISDGITPALFRQIRNDLDELLSTSNNVDTFDLREESNDIYDLLSQLSIFNSGYEISREGKFLGDYIDGEFLASNIEQQVMQFGTNGIISIVEEWFGEWSGEWSDGTRSRHLENIDYIWTLFQTSIAEEGISNDMIMTDKEFIIDVFIEVIIDEINIIRGILYAFLYAVEKHFDIFEFDIVNEDNVNSVVFNVVETTEDNKDAITDFFIDFMIKTLTIAMGEDHPDIPDMEDFFRNEVIIEDATFTMTLNVVINEDDTLEFTFEELDYTFPTEIEGELSIFSERLRLSYIGEVTRQTLKD